jgi:D-3-phosphoglycerate dehydrogenase / 2-oxoglutarate reductase
MIKVAVTDFGGGEVEIEKKILEPLGCTVELKQCKTTEELIHHTQDADYVITQFAKVNAEVINAMKKNKIIVRYGVGVDNVDLDAAAKKGIPVCNVPDYCIDEVADQTLAMLLSLTRRVSVLSNYVHGGKWGLPFSFEKILCLKGMTVGLVAFGKISREVALRLKPFKANILVFDPGVDAAVVKEAGCTPVTLDELYAKSDIISLHCPSNAKTRLMINADSIRKMKKGVLLVNTSRGDLVKTEDLIEALKSGQIDAVALDVTNPEPINTDNPLLKMDNVIITPHMASCSPVAPTVLREKVAQAVACAIQGKKLPNVVNGVNK